MRLATALLVASLALPAGAGADALPELGAGAQTGAGWVALKITSAGTNVVLDLVVTDVRTPNFLEVYKYDGADRFLGGVGVGSVRREGGVHVDVAPTGEPVLTHDATFAPGFPTMEWSPTLGTRVGVTKLLVWSSGPQSGWTWRLRGGADVTLEATEEGSGSWAIMSHDMAGAADVRAHDPVFGTYGGRASVERARAVEVKNRLIGFYVGGSSTPPVTNNLLSIQGAGGEEICYPGCSFADYVGGKGPGTYAFRLRAGMGAVWSGNDDVLAVAVDARLPA